MSFFLGLVNSKVEEPAWAFEEVSKMDEITSQSATTLAQLIRNRKVSPVEVLQAYLDRIERINPKLNAIVTIAADAIEKAGEAEAAVLRGDAIGPLHGVPLTIKDTIETKELRTTSGSAMRAGFIPEDDAPSVARLKAAGAIILGKTNTAEMAMDYTADNPVFGRTNNPHDPSLTPGGSSGGEAAAIAACLVPWRNRQRPRRLNKNSVSLLRHRWFEANGRASAGRWSVSAQHRSLFARRRYWSNGARSKRPSSLVQRACWNRNPNLFCQCV